MSDDLRKELERYLERAQLELRAVDLNLQKGFYAVAVSRAYYAMFYPNEEFAQAELDDAKRFVKRIERYLHESGELE